MTILDPAVESHVVAFHEAGHAAAIDRLRLRVRSFWIREWPDGAVEGECTHAGQPVDLSPAEIEANNRIIFLAGVAAEVIFAGAANTDECDDDLEQADLCSEFLGEDPERARDDLLERLTEAIERPEMRGALELLACLVLERGVIDASSLHEVHDVFAERVGLPEEAWP